MIEPGAKLPLPRFLILPALWLSACTPTTQDAQSASPPAPGCFNVAMARGYDPIGQHTVAFDPGHGPTYVVDFSGPQCETIDWSHRILIESTASSLICSGNEVDHGNISFRDPLAPYGTTCHIDAVRVAPTN